MIVRLTARRLDAVHRTAGADPDMAAALHTIPDVGTQRQLVEAPYAAWLWIREQMIDEIYTRRGTRRQGIPVSVVGALKDVAKAVGFIDRHPALRGAGVLGHHGLVLPVWKTRRDHAGRVYSPYPLLDHEFVYLKPVWHDGAGASRTTTWSHAGMAPAGTRLGDEMFHQRLRREPVAGLWDEQFGRP